MLPPVTTEKQARAIMAAGLGRAELEFVTSLTAPLYWIMHEGDKKYRVRNGSAFFLDAGQGPFAVTAHHVVEGWRRDRGSGNVVALQLAHDLPIDFNGKNALIVAHAGLDIATFRISAAEAASIKKTPLTGYQSTWPPSSPEPDKGIYFSGFPSVGNGPSGPENVLRKIYLSPGRNGTPGAGSGFLTDVCLQAGCRSSA
jgi:hypothetical protein